MGGYPYPPLVQCIPPPPLQTLRSPPHVRAFRVKMIDFAHVHPTPNGGLDESYLSGLKFLQSSLTSGKLLNRSLGTIQ